MIIEWNNLLKGLLMLKYDDYEWKAFENIGKYFEDVNESLIVACID